MANSTHPETFTRVREETPTISHGSRTITVNEIEEADVSDTSENDEGEEVGVLRLTGDMNARRRRVIQWDDSVIDNEHMNKKKTKICCIYHKPRAVGESSSESSSDSDSSDSDSSDERKCNHQHHKKKRNPREVSPNAYERQPVYNKARSVPTTSQ